MFLRATTTLLLALALAPVAQAATTVTTKITPVDEEGALISNDVEMTISGGDEQNTVTLSALGESVRVADASTPVVAGKGCVQAGPNAATCAVAPNCALTVKATLGAGADNFNSPQRPQCDNGSSPSTLGLGPGDDSAETDWVRVTGSDGNDTIVARNASGDTGNDTLRSPSPNGASLNGGGGNDSITGGPGDDLIDGSLGDDLLNGGGGNDRFDVGAGSDQVDGGPGLDLVEYLGDAITLDLSQSPSRVKHDDGSDVLTSIEGGRGDLREANTLIGSEGDDVLGYALLSPFLRYLGTGAPDTIDGRGGNDRLSADSPKATLLGGAGDDLLMPFTRTSDCGPGRDRVGYVGRLDLKRALRGCELLLLDEDAPALALGSARIRRGKLELTLVDDKTRRTDVMVQKRGATLAHGSIRLTAKVPRRIRLPLTKRARSLLAHSTRLAARLDFLPTGGDYASQDVTIRR